MKNADFRHWLKGYFELAGEEAVLTPPQLQVIVNHLNLAEAEEGALDEANRGFRADIESFRGAAGGDLRLLTESLRGRVLAG